MQGNGEVDKIHSGGDDDDLPTDGVDISDNDMELDKIRGAIEETNIFKL